MLEKFARIRTAEHIYSLYTQYHPGNSVQRNAIRCSGASFSSAPRRRRSPGSFGPKVICNYFYVSVCVFVLL